MDTYRGHIFDGETARRHEATIRFGRDALEIEFADGTVNWPYDEVRQAAPPVPGEAVRLVRASGGVERLVVDGSEFLAALRNRCPGLNEHPGGGTRRARIAMWFGIVVGLVLIAAGTVHYFPPLAARLIPAKWERALGARAIDQVISVFAAMGDGKAGKCESNAGSGALERLVGKLEAKTESPHPFQVSVANIKIVNAIAAPGGHIALFRGLIDQADSPDEVAGVLAHEMGHVVALHATEAMVRNIGLTALLDALTGNMAGSEVLAPMAGAALGASYSRGAEEEADALGLAILRRAGIAPFGMAAFFERMAAKGKELPGLLKYLSSHPSNEARARLARAQATDAHQPALSPRDWDDLRNICGEAQPGG